MESRSDLIGKALEEIRRQISEASSHLDTENKPVQLIAVSKKICVAAICDAYDLGVRHFGENYVQELMTKANDPEILEKCPDIKWHFIGHLQKNKINSLIKSCPNLYLVQTVDSIEKADVLNKSLAKKEVESPLKICIQVNTSEETNKGGVPLENVEKVFKHVLEKCDHLQLCGLMTIGAVDHSLELGGDNPDFISLRKCRDDMAAKFDMTLELSMGMSADFEHAIKLGSTMVRIGTKIFGSRPT